MSKIESYTDLEVYLKLFIIFNMATNIPERGEDVIANNI